MFCPKCGTELPDGSKFCGSCGAQLASPAPAASVDVPVGDAAASGSTGTGAPDLKAGAAKSRKMGFIVGGIALVAVAVLAVAAFVLVNSLGLLGGGKKDTNERFNNVSLNYTSAASGEGWDYFYSDKTGAIMRAKTDGTVENIVTIPTETTDYGYTYPSRYVQRIAVDGSDLYYLCYPSMPDESSAYEVHRVDITTGDDAVIYTLPSTDGEDSYSISWMSVYDHQVYLLETLYPESGDNSIDLMVLDAEGNEVLHEDKYRESAGSLPSPGVTPTLDIYSTYDYDNGVSSGALYTAGEVNGNFVNDLVYETDNGMINNYALVGDRIAFSVTGGTRDIVSVMMANRDGSDLTTLYTAPTDMWGTMVAATDDTVFVRQYSSEDYDVVSWDLVAVPVAGGEAQTIASNLDYYNASVAVVNGHLLIMENGQDIASQGMRVAAYSFEGELLATYV